MGGGSGSKKNFDIVDDVILFPKKVWESATNTELTEARGAEPTPEMQQQMRAAERARIEKDEKIDEESRKEILTKFDNKEDISQLYQQALDPDNATTKDRKRRQAAAKTERDTPGLRKQTSFLGAGGGPTSYLDGGR
jgi:hypothetical protein